MRGGSRHRNFGKLLLLIIPADEGMGDRVDRKCDAVLHAYFSHELGHMGLYRALLDRERLPNFPVGASGDQKLQDLFLAIGEADPAGRKNLSRRGRYPIDEDRHYATGSPNGSLMDDADCLNKFGGTGGLFYIALGASGQSFEDGFVVCAGAGHYDAQVRTRGLEACHHVKDAAAATTTVSNQREIDILQTRQLFERRGREFEIGLIIKKGPKPDKAQRVTINDSNVDRRLLGSRSFHNLVHGVAA